MIPAKQIDQVLAASVRIAGFTANGGSNTATTAITTALATAGDGGVSVPLQPSVSNGLGVITSGVNNRIEVYNATSKDKILAANGEEIYARLTETGGVYTLTYYTLPDSGTETAYTFSGATTIDFEFGYRFDFARLPTDALIATSTRNISNDPSGSGGKPYVERLTVTATNTIANATKTPIDTSTFTLIVNGEGYDTLSGSPVAVNLSTKAVTWTSATAGFSLETTDRVIARYFTFE